MQKKWQATKLNSIQKYSHISRFFIELKVKLIQNLFGIQFAHSLIRYLFSSAIFARSLSVNPSPISGVFDSIFPI